MTQTHDTQQPDQVQDADQVQDGTTGGESEALVTYNVETLASFPGAREAFLAMLEGVPEPDDDASARIVMQVMAATSVEDLDKPWDVEGMRDYAGSMLRVNRVVKMPSNYTTGLGVYLVCYCTQPEVGEEFVLTTGSVAIVAQLVAAHVGGWLPLEVIPRESEKPTRKGYRPMHLELVRRGRRARAQVIDQPSPQREQRDQQAARRRATILDEARVGIQADGAGERAR